MSGFRLRDAPFFAVMMPKRAVRSTCIVAILLGLGPLGNSTAALALQSAPAPKNLRVTGVTDWTVTLAWDAVKGKAPASYVIQCSNGRTMTVAGSQTTATFSSGFDYSRTYSFRMYAVSSSGAWSGASNTVTATLLKDTTPAPRPVVSSTGTGPTHVDLAWSYSGNDPSPRFDIYVNGELWQGQLAGTTKRIVFLSPDTTYTITVSALLVPVVCLAQQPTGTLAGIVRDPANAAIGGVRVIATSRATHQVRTTTTGSGGEYSVPALLPGEYDLVAEAPGFQ